MKELPAIINYYKKGTEFFNIASNGEVVRFSVIGASLEETPDIGQHGKIMYTVSREDGKFFNVSDTFIRHSFPTRELAETSLSIGRDEPDFEHLFEPNATANTRAILISQYGIKDARIKDKDGYISVFGWFWDDSQPVWRANYIDILIDSNVHFTFESLMYDTMEKCINENVCYYYHKAFKNSLSFAIKGGIENDIYSDGISDERIWKRSEDFVKYAIGAIQAFSGKMPTDAETIVITKTVHDTAKDILQSKGVYVLE